MKRRDFLAASAAPLAQAQAVPRPNILWVTCEDMSPNLGCYGDRFARSPTIDTFATQSIRYKNAWSNAPVCAPARTTIISGMYPPSTGSEHMRSETKLAPDQKMFPQILREEGYYTSNNSKEDYNLVHTGKVWDESSNKAHWRNRSANQPFFSVFNYVITHESQIRAKNHVLKHDPREVRVPSYMPDTPEVRRDWAQYYDNITTMDGMVKKTLGELAADGLANDTIVFFYSDHGAGMPRSKRWPYNSGCQVPMMVHLPEKFRSLAPKDYAPGAWSDRLVSFVDLAPTALSLIGRKPESYHQGIPFLGPHAGSEPEYVFGFRGRMDERIDLVRSVRSKTHVYIRQYMPHRIYGQNINYMMEMPTAQVWKKTYDSGKATADQKHFWEPKPAEELYELASDTDEVKNLALNPTPAQKEVLTRMRNAQRALATNIRDLGFLPEHEIHARSGSDAPNTMGKSVTRYDAASVQRAAEHATGPMRLPLEELRHLFTSKESGVRYWAAIGYLNAKVATPRDLLQDAAPSVAIVAAETLIRYGTPAEEKPAVALLLNYSNAEQHGNYLAIAALNALSNIGAAKLKPHRDTISALPKDNKSNVQRSQGYVPRLIEYLLEITA